LLNTKIQHKLPIITVLTCSHGDVEKSGHVVKVTVLTAIVIFLQALDVTLHCGAMSYGIALIF